MSSPSQSTKQSATVSDSPKIVDAKTLVDEIEQIYRSVAECAYERFEVRGRDPGHDLEDWLTAEAELLPPVLSKVTEFEDRYTIHAEISGFATDFQVGIEPQRLIVVGRNKRLLQEQPEGNAFTSRHEQHLVFTVDVAADVDLTQTTARVVDDTLEVTLPKRITSQPKGGPQGAGISGSD